MTTTADKLVDDYLKRLRRELGGLPRERRRELEQEISGHIAEARASLSAQNEAEIRTLLDRIGDPADIAAEARERFGVQPRRTGWKEIGALILLPIGGVIVPVLGWFVGVVLLWVSEAWSTRDKLIGTFVLPGGCSRRSRWVHRRFQRSVRRDSRRPRRELLERRNRSGRPGGCDRAVPAAVGHDGVPRVANAPRDGRPRDLSELAEVRQAVERGLPGTTAFLQALVRVPSLLASEEPAQELVEARLRELGFDVSSIEPDEAVLAEHAESGIPLVPYDGRRCLVGTTGGGSGRSLLLNGHVDVVSAEPVDRWTRDPFGAEIEGDRLYGRGACDMKGGVTAMLLGVEAALALGPLPGPLVYQSVIEEECGGNGALSACLHGPRADAALIAEPTNGNLDLVAVGVIWARITLEASARHASHADEGSNPIEAAFPLIEALHGLERELNAEAEPEFKGVERPYLLNVGALHAGDWPSMTPGEAELDVRLGFPVRMEPAEAQARLAEAVARADAGAAVEFRGFRARGYAFDPDSEFVRLLCDCHEELHGRRPVPEPSRATTDLRFFEPGPAACYGPTGDGLHGVDEWVDLPSIADVATVIALLIRRWGA